MLVLQKYTRTPAHGQGFRTSKDSIALVCCWHTLGKNGWLRLLYSTCTGSYGIVRSWCVQNITHVWSTFGTSQRNRFFQRRALSQKMSTVIITVHNVYRQRWSVYKKRTDNHAAPEGVTTVWQHFTSLELERCVPRERLALLWLGKKECKWGRQNTDATARRKENRHLCHSRYVAHDHRLD